MKRVGLYTAALGFMAFAGFPFYWMLITAFKQTGICTSGRSTQSTCVDLQRPADPGTRAPCCSGRRNSCAGSGTLSLSSSRSSYHGGGGGAGGLQPGAPHRAMGRAAGHGIFFTYLIPATLLFIPFSRVISFPRPPGFARRPHPDLSDESRSICTWLVMGFLRSVPWDIEEQAMIDGYRPLAVIVRVVPRLIVPGILTVVVFTFTPLVHAGIVYAADLHQLGRSYDRQLGRPIALVRGDVYPTGAPSWPPHCSSASRSPSSTTCLWIGSIQGFTMGAVKG